MDEPFTPPDSMDMAQILEDHPEIKEGQVVTGQVVKIEDEHIVVDIGYKSEGHIPRHEFTDVDGALTVAPGDTVDVAVERLGTDFVRLSKRHVDRARLWQELEAKIASEETIRGRVLKRVKGGFRVDLGSVQAFLPFSQATLERNPLEEELLDRVFPFRVIQVDPARQNVVVSRRPLLEAERAERRRHLLEALKPGEIREGRVKSVTAYGAFVDLGGVDGLLQVTDLDWVRVRRVEDKVKPGDTVNVMVLQVDRESGKVSLGLKQTRPDPWQGADERYPVGSDVEVEPVHWVDYGVFLRTAEGLEGFCHLTELSWSKKQKNPREVAPPGTKLRARVLEVKPDKHKLSLSLKRLQPSPWEGAASRWKVGQIVKVRVLSQADFGLFCELEEGLEGLLHATDVTWDRHAKDPHKSYAPGTELTVKILALDEAKKRLSFGLKQVEGDPWEAAVSKWKGGEKVSGKVTRAEEYGVFVEVEPHVEGLLHRSEMGRKSGKSAGTFSPGSTVEAYILSVDPKRRRLSLSLRPPRGAPAPDDPQRVEHTTKGFSRLLKRFLKNASKDAGGSF